MKQVVLVGLVGLAACGDGGSGGIVDAAVDAREISCGELTCSGSEFCDFEVNTCGAAGEARRCSAAGTCDSASPVCGCDGAIHGSECEAQASGVDVDVNFGCAKAAGQFACGYTPCSLTNQVCTSTWRGSGPLQNSTYRCISLPAQCTTTPTCECVFANAGGMWSGCMGDASSGFTLFLAPGIR